MAPRPSVLCLAGLLALPGSAPAPQDAPAPSILGKVEKPWSLNNPVLEFRLPDLAGKEHVVLGPREERATLIVFWSFRDPPSRFYVPALTRLAREHAKRVAVWLVNSNADELVGGNADPLERVRAWFREEEVELTLLLDRDNRVADDFAAICNGQVFLIDGNRVLRYHGGVDDDPDGTRAAGGKPVETWLDDALAALLDGRLPEQPWTRPTGRPIKRAKKVGGG
jgi:hypothetical protein